MEIGCDEVVSTHAHPGVGGQVGKHPKGSAAHGPTPGLIVVDAGHLSAALDTKAGFERAVALDLVYPNELDKASTSG